jgi:hypothetical protein
MRLERSPHLLSSLLLPLALLLVSCAEDDPAPISSTPDSGETPNQGSNNPGDSFDRDDNRDDDDNDDVNSPAPVNLPPAQPVDDATRTQCGDASCRDVLVGDIIVPPCCPEGATDRCGLNLAVVEPFMALQGSCVELEQPGTQDGTCPMVLFDDPVSPKELAGCCMPEGLCGVMADLSDLLADFGCVDPRGFLAGRAPASPPDPNQSVNPPDTSTIHLLDGGGYFIDAGNGAGGPDAGATNANDMDALRSCTPPPPAPDAEPRDAGRGPALDAAAGPQRDAGAQNISDASASSPPALGLDAGVTAPLNTDSGVDAGGDGPANAEANLDAATPGTDAG